MYKREALPFIPALAVLAGLFLLTNGCYSESDFVLKQSEKVYIVDRTGRQWDITQAVASGMRPGGFQYGIGVNAFTPLDDNSLSDDSSGLPSSSRVIGIASGSEARAYSVGKLRRHEVANSRISGKPVAVGY